MADRIVQLADKDGNNLFPVTNVSNAPTITMTTTDPGSGSALGTNEFVAVYGTSDQVQTADIATAAVTTDKIDSTTFFYEADSVAPVSVDTTPVTLKTVTLPKKGNYAIFVRSTQSGAVSATNGALIYVALDLNNTQIYQVEGATYANYAGNGFSGTTLVYGITANAGDELKIKVSKSRNNFTPNLGCNYVVMQVA